MDRSKRDALLKRVGDVNSKSAGLILVSLEDFFEGNDDGGSIWCNLSTAPEPRQVYAILSQIRDRPDVVDVRILVTQYDGGDEEWPFSDTVYFLTARTPDDIVSWLGNEYAPDEIGVEPDFGRAEPIDCPNGTKIVTAWWD